MVDTELPMIEFTAHDRCDRCGARAISMATHDEHTELLFCGHHRREHAQMLMDEGWTIVDDYEQMEQLAPNFYKAPL